jgi:hypothetical protein
MRANPMRLTLEAFPHIALSIEPLGLYDRISPVPSWRSHWRTVFHHTHTASRVMHPLFDSTSAAMVDRDCGL